jgi:molybdopterin converting factor small subunit
MLVKIKSYGSFRWIGETFDLEIPERSTVGQLKTLMSHRLQGQDAVLVFDSVLANDQRILSDEDLVNAEENLSILPPVCGG